MPHSLPVAPLRRRSVLTRAVFTFLVVGGLALAWLLARGARAFWIEYRQFGARHWTVPLPDDAMQLGIVDVRFASRDGTRLRGWSIPSRNGAAVILCQGSSSDRSTVLDDARPLVAAGFGVLVFDWPGTGESEGEVRYAAPERDALRGAIDHLAAAPGVDATRIGVLGFSTGSYTAVQVAATDPRIAALVLAGVWDDPIVHARHEYGAAGRAAVWGSLLALRLAGMPLTDQRPVDVVGQLSPRPVVIVSGSRDAVVPTVLSRRVFDAAGEPKAFWLIEGAGHGDYLRVDPGYGQRLVEFFARTLVGGGGSSGAASHDVPPMRVLSRCTRPAPVVGIGTARVP